MMERTAATQLPAGASLPNTSLNNSRGATQMAADDAGLGPTDEQTKRADAEMAAWAVLFAEHDAEVRAAHGRNQTTAPLRGVVRKTRR